MRHTSNAHLEKETVTKSQNALAEYSCDSFSIENVQEPSTAMGEFRAEHGKGTA